MLTLFKKQSYYYHYTNPLLYYIINFQITKRKIPKIKKLSFKTKSRCNITTKEHGIHVLKK